MPEVPAEPQIAAEPVIAGSEVGTEPVIAGSEPAIAGPEPGLCLEVACEIGRALAAAAVWHEHRCSWIGAWPEETPRGIAVTYKALGPDLYAGTAGVGIFLAELGCAVADDGLRACALGALRHAATRAQAGAALTPLGLYGGSLGVALALAHCARLLDEPELDAGARALVRALDELGAGSENGEFDLVSGRAGAIVGLLALAASLDEPELLEPAVEHGEALLATARADAGGLSWRAPHASAEERGLAGFSHGAAGVASALLELAAASGSSRFGEAALQAFAYERTLFDERARNWPDLRESIRGMTGGAPAFSTFWCHGAPGIALARVRALELEERAPGRTGAGSREVKERLRAEADIALDTTAAWVQEALDAGAVSYSLCHGLAGNAEILQEGCRVEGLPRRSLAGSVASHGIERYRSSESGWPSGVQGGATPSLFLGDAGVGRFYLRLAQPSLSSLLAIRPEDFAAGGDPPGL